MPSPQIQTTLYIIYNANASIIGKLNYGFRKLTAGKDAPPACAACDITHGGLHLDETDDWKRAKEELLRQKGGNEGGVELKQLHRDEVSGDVSLVSIRSVAFRFVSFLGFSFFCEFGCASALLLLILLSFLFSSLLWCLVYLRIRGVPFCISLSCFLSSPFVAKKKLVIDLFSKRFTHTYASPGINRWNNSWRRETYDIRSFCRNKGKESWESSWITKSLQLARAMRRLLWRNLWRKGLFDRTYNILRFKFLLGPEEIYRKARCRMRVSKWHDFRMSSAAKHQWPPKVNFFDRRAIFHSKILHQPIFATHNAPVPNRHGTLSPYQYASHEFQPCHLP